jgi:co-chaperonin GroES (HSP10)
MTATAFGSPLVYDALDEQPLDDNFLVLPDPVEEITGAGVHVTAPEPKTTGTIIACGPEVKPPLANGARVRWWTPPNSGITINKVQYYLMNRSDIGTIITPGDPDDA